MTIVEFVAELEAIAGDRYCSAQIDVTRHGASARRKVTWHAYIDGIGWGDQSVDPRVALNSLVKAAQPVDVAALGDPPADETEAAPPEPSAPSSVEVPL